MAAVSGWHTSRKKTGAVGTDLTKNNTSGFSALPGGYRYTNGPFYPIGEVGYWWSSTEGSTLTAWYRSLGYDNNGSGRYDISKSMGFSVRCLQDSL